MTGVSKISKANQSTQKRLLKSTSLDKSAWALIAEAQKSVSTPISAMIEIVDRCNEVCIHCYQVQGQKGEMTTEEIKSVLEQLAEMGVLFLTFSGGEATLRKDFLELVRYAREKRFAVKVYSNGLRIDEAMADALAGLAVSEVQLSLYSHDPETHDFVTGVKGSHEKLVRAAKLLMDRNVHVLCKTPLMKGINDASQAEYIDFVQAMGADFSFDPNLDAREDGARDPEALRIDGKTRREALKAYDANGESIAFEQELRSPALEQAPCGACSGNIHIEPNGEMRPCTLLDTKVGDVREDKIRDAYFNNPVANEIRSIHWKDLPDCRICDLQPYCGRCFSAAKVESGDALAPYPAACSSAIALFEVKTGQSLVLGGEEGATGFPKTGPYEVVLPNGDLSDCQLRPRESRMQIDQTTPESSWRYADGERALVPRRENGLVQIARPNKKKQMVQLPTDET